MYSVLVAQPNHEPPQHHATHQQHRGSANQEHAERQARTPERRSHTCAGVVADRIALGMGHRIGPVEGVDGDLAIGGREAHGTTA